MEKVIEGKLYDTDKARQVAIAVGNDVLYCTAKGRYFIEYDRQVGSGQWVSYARDLRAMSREQAMRWGEQHMTPAAWAAEFGETLEEA